MSSSTRPEPARAETPNQRERREEDELLASLVGRRIVSTFRRDNSDYEGEWLGGVKLTLDDGRDIEFEGWGHDWWGLSLGWSEPEPPRD